MQPSVSVIITVYNKEGTLRRAIESALMQKVDFVYKILIVDDGSEDRSADIISEYEKKYPDTIIYCQNDQNIGLGETIFWAYYNLDTKYFTVLDADDYWINDRKIYKAVHFLEEHEDYSSYGSNFYVEADGEERVAAVQADGDRTATNVLEVTFLQTSASVFRNYFSQEILDDINKRIDGRRVHPFQADTFRNHLSIHFGKQYFENSLDSVYDVGSGNGIWSRMTPFERSVLNVNIYYEIYDFLRTEFGEDLNSEYCIRTSKKVYEQAVAQLAVVMQQHRLSELKLDSYVIDSFRFEDASPYNIVLKLLEFERILG